MVINRLVIQTLPVCRIEPPCAVTPRGERTHSTAEPCCAGREAQGARVPTGPMHWRWKYHVQEARGGSTNKGGYKGRAADEPHAQWKWQTERWTQPRPKPHRDRGSCSPPYRGEVRPRAATARAKHLSYGVHLVISTWSFSPSHTTHVHGADLHIHSNVRRLMCVYYLIPTTACVHVVCGSNSQLAGPEPRHVSSVLRWCSAPSSMPVPPPPPTA